MEITKSTRIAYAEIDSFIELLPRAEKEKIPSKLKQYFKDEKDKETPKKLSMDIPIEKQNLQEETWNLIAMIYLKYLCEDEEEKKEQDHFIYNGLKYAHKVIDTRQCDMVVLDEVLGLLDLGLLKTEELVEMLENRSDDQTIIMTGRQIPEALIPYADAVYEISTIKES